MKGHNFIVVSGKTGKAFSCHTSRLLAVTKIAWFWKRIYPNHEFFVQDLS